MENLKFTYLFVFFLIINACSTNNKTTSNNSSTQNRSENAIKGERIYFSGLKEKVKENYSLALKYFEQAVKLNPKIDAAYYETSLIKYQQRDFKNALSNIESALKIDDKNHWYREFYAELLSSTGKFDKAASVFKKLRLEFPYNQDYYFSEAHFLLKDNKNKEAIKVYNELEERTEISEDITNEKYVIFLREKDINGAEKELEKLSNAFPNNLKHLNRLAAFQLSNNMLEKAIEIYERILKVNPNNTRALMSLADYYKSKGDIEKYKEYSKQAFTNKGISLDVKISILYSILRESEKDSSKLKEAYEYAKLLSDSYPEDAKPWAIYGDIYNIDNNSEEALKMYHKSLAIRSDVFSVWRQVFFIESDAKKYDLLIKDTESAMELFPNQAFVYFFNGAAYQQKKAYTKSNKSYEKGVKMAIKNPGLKAQFYSSLGENYNKLKDFEKSDDNFEKALDIDPNSQYVLNNYAYYLSLREEKLERAKEMSLKSLELSPNNPTYLDTYAWVLFKNNEFEAAFKNQQKAVELSKNPSAALFDHLGDMLLKLDRVKEAVINWEKAKEKGNKTKELLKKISDNQVD